jgi:anhydro-N-acetylmuramic acid kinase
MSGTSLDGLDLTLCSFSRTNSKWEYHIIKAATLPYPAELSGSLNNAIHLEALELCKLDHDYGKWIGKAVLQFLGNHKAGVDWIASHGHTIFHQPSKGFTLQIGNGNDIHAITGLPVIFDFRSLDVALGGQGAPLVPVGDRYLFGKYDSCLNLGGFSNISFEKDNMRQAFDICPVNMGLNYLSEKLGLEFDEDGKTGREGEIIPGIVKRLNNLEYYKQRAPKSLGREWFIQNIEPILVSENNIKDILRSLYEHISLQISLTLNEFGGESILVTGGGAKNKFLLELISQKTKCRIVIPESDIVDFKEALIFAFLGYLRVNNIPNVFSSVTGASRDSCSGLVVGELI